MLYPVDLDQYSRKHRELLIHYHNTRLYFLNTFSLFQISLILLNSKTGSCYLNLRMMAKIKTSIFIQTSNS